MAQRKRGRPSDYYTPGDVADIFKIGLSTVYKDPEALHGRIIYGSLRFPKPIVDAIRREDGIDVSK